VGIEHMQFDPQQYTRAQDHRGFRFHQDYEVLDGSRFLPQQQPTVREEVFGLQPYETKQDFAQQPLDDSDVFVAGSIHQQPPLSQSFFDTRLTEPDRWNQKQSDFHARAFPSLAECSDLPGLSASYQSSQTPSAIQAVAQSGGEVEPAWYDDHGNLNLVFQLDSNIDYTSIPPASNIVYSQSLEALNDPTLEGILNQPHQNHMSDHDIPEPVSTPETRSDKHGKAPNTPSREQAAIINGPSAKSSVPSLKPSGLYFSSVTEARQVVQGLNWDPRPDDSLPQNQQEREAIIHELFDAMQDMSVVQDKKSGLTLKKRWVRSEAADKMEDEGGEEPEGEAEQHVASDAFYQRWQKEKICWEILVSTHQSSHLMITR
jgi:hypothetical protein